MSRPEETFAVLKALGDSKVDNMAVIRIEQEEKKNCRAASTARQ
jgi:hypothetical protein